MERTTGFEPATLTFARLWFTSADSVPVPCRGLLSAGSSVQPVHCAYSVYRSTIARRQRNRLLANEHTDTMA